MFRKDRGFGSILHPSLEFLYSPEKMLKIHPLKKPQENLLHISEKATCKTFDEPPLAWSRWACGLHFFLRPQSASDGRIQGMRSLRLLIP